MKLKYTLAYMDMAERFAQTSVDERRKVAALLYDPEVRTFISMGINGTPEGWHTNVCQDETNTTKPEVRHAEVSALNKLRQLPIGARGSYMFVTTAPCYFCAIDVAEAGITRVYFRTLYRSNDGLTHLLNKGLEVYYVSHTECVRITDINQLESLLNKRRKT